MTADSDRAAIDAAWRRVPRSPESVARVGAFTRTRVERILSLVIAVGCAVLGVQGLITSLNTTAERSEWHPAMELIVFLPLGLMLMACVVGRFQRALAAIFVVIYTAALVIWPVAAAGVPSEPEVEPWIFFLLNVATVAAVLAFPLVWQIVCAVVIPVLWGVVRLIQAGFDPRYAIPVVLDVSFALILGGILVALGWMLRSVATNVDTARAKAVSSYAAAAAAEATEQERVAVGALMHDSVLAALIAVERAHTDRERTLAVGMAREALTRLANAESDAGMGSEAPVDAETIAHEIEVSAAETGSGLRVERSQLDGVRLPGVVARALALAATQAITNAVQHADGAGLRVAVHCEREPVRVTVRVSDSGAGFDPDAVPADRLGIRASIHARVAAVGGRARISSGSGGTRVTMEWADTA
ncbi:ATP-binding protein [Microbacterium horticulturae]|uniref:ATP-binding protein n=1 Tax=Microbacterium horticulturae TaxID=3028316 RepID=A0ABY8BVJ9_9MICO|nr:sensor histidine kinase [Microbacterium sp. KACC 23027]WEG07925.1 ATP-binding protein [Microbacterium sp. KACC 23027]